MALKSDLLYISNEEKKNNHEADVRVLLVSQFARRRSPDFTGCEVHEE